MTKTDANLPIDTWPIEKVIPYEKNAKLHSEADVEKLARSIKRFGWLQPIIVDGNGIIIAGHGRRLAAQKLGLKKVPVIVRKDLSEEEVRAARLADNKVVALGYDVETMQAELQALADIGFDLENVGFDEKELDFLTRDLGEMDDDAFIDDLADAVEAETSAGTKAIETTDAKEVPVAKALGFKSVTSAGARTLAEFLSKIEDLTGKRGAEALLAHARTILGA